jgi:hypothetical protein
MSRPQAHSLGSDLPHALHDEIQRLIPTDASLGIRAAIIADLGVQQSSWIAEDLACCAAAHAKEALAVRVLLVAGDSLQPAAFHLDQQSAERWMTIHGTHGPHDFRGSHGLLHLGRRG